MIDSITKRIIGITLVTIAIHVLFHGIHSNGFSNTYYIISMISYCLWIIVDIKGRIEIEVIKEIIKLRKELNSK